MDRTVINMMIVLYMAMPCSKYRFSCTHAVQVTGQLWQAMTHLPYL